MPELNFFLNASPTLRKLVSQATQLMDTERTFRATAPQALARHCRVAGLEHGILMIISDNGAIAAKLKQQQSTLLINLQKRGLKISSIRIRVHPVQRAAPAVAKGAALGPQAVATLQDLAQHLDDSPLKKALQAMIAGHSNKKEVKSN